MDIYEDETLDLLGKVNKKIIQKKKGFRFSIDSVILANFLELDGDRLELADIGTGTGIIPLLLSEREQLKKIYGIEIQSEIAKMASRSIIYNDLTNKIEIIEKDIKNIERGFKVDVISTNPPYMKVNEGIVSTNEYKAISRHEVKMDLDLLLSKSKEMLCNGGSFNIVYRTERFEELINIIGKYGFGVKRVRFIYSKPKSDSNLFVLEAIKGKNIKMRVLDALYIMNSNGDYTEEVESYYF